MGVKSRPPRGKPAPRHSSTPRRFPATRQPPASRPSADPGATGRRTNWNTVLLEQIRLAGLPEPIREYVFHANRNWRFDFCWRGGGLLVACEIEGGIWMQTDTGRSKGHAHPERFEQDCEKYNEAALYGWTLIRVTPDMIRDGRALDWLDRALRP